MQVSKKKLKKLVKEKDPKKVNRHVKKAINREAWDDPLRLKVIDFAYEYLSPRLKRRNNLHA
jgi:hypothetical protein